MENNRKFWLASAMMIVGGAGVCYGYHLPWYSYFLPFLMIAFFFFSSENEKKRWAKAVAKYENFMEWSNRYLASANKFVETGQKYIENGEYLLALYREQEGLPQEEETWSEATRTKMVQLYFRLKKMGKITFH
ncbi:MAG: hypothetical protein WC460_02960 [Patescibacteria group bacterium]